MKPNTRLCPMCGAAPLRTYHEYQEPPLGEMAFTAIEAQPYRRKILQCLDCGHFVSVHDLDLSKLYDWDYVQTTYGAQDLGKAFERVKQLPKEKSDNAARVERLETFFQSRSSSVKTDKCILDVGTGIGIFPYAMKEKGWNCTAIDPDLRSVEHASKCLGIRSVRGDFMTLELNERFDVISFNKVLEHVEDPVAMLHRSHDFLKKGGIVYVELPDGVGASKEGPGREEFFIDHHHVFSLMSIRLLAELAGFRVVEVESLREPSSKFTLRAFLEKTD